MRPALVDEGIVIVRWDQLAEERAGRPARHVPRGGVPGAHAAGRRPGAPVPVHLRPLAEPRGRAGQPQDRQRALRPRQGAAAAAPLHPGDRPGRATPRSPTSTTPASSRSRTSSPRTSTSSSPGWRSASTTCSGSPATRTSRSRRTTPRTSSTALEKELTRRRFGPPVRLEVADDMDDHVLDLLIRELGVNDSEVYRLPAPLDLRGLNVVADLERSELRFPPFVPQTHPDLAAVESSPTPATSSPRSGRATSCCSTPTTRSRRRCRPSSSRPRPTPRCWPSSRRSTAPAATAPSSTPSSTPPRPASRCSPSSRSRPASTSRPTSAGPASSSTPASTWSTASSG